MATDTLYNKTQADSTFVKKVPDDATAGQTITGPLNIKKDLIVDGLLKQNTYELDNNIDFSITTAGQTAGISIPYSHVRKSNGKLNIVILVNARHPTNISTFAFNTNIHIPESVGSQLYPSLTGSVIATDSKNTIALNDDGSPSTIKPQEQYTMVYIVKNSNTSLGIGGQADLTASTTLNYVWRFEFNFILS